MAAALYPTAFEPESDDYEADLILECFIGLLGL